VDATFTIGTLPITGTVTQFNTPAGTTNPIIADAANPGLTGMPTHPSQIAVQIDGRPTGDDAIQQVTSTYVQGNVPEPATYALIGGALLGLSLVFRKRA
jgi:hypothetical protein